MRLRLFTESLQNIRNLFIFMRYNIIKKFDSYLKRRVEWSVQISI